MKIAHWFTLLICLLTLGATGPLFSQAHISGSQTATLYVDAASGSDSNPGTQSYPFRTIGAATAAAIKNNQRGVGTIVLVEPGVYREWVKIWLAKGQTGAPITLQAVQPGTAIVDGADVLTGWYAINSTQYAHSWKEPSAPCQLPSGWPGNLQPIVLRTDMVFVNGAPLTQVLTSAQMRAGTFYVDGEYQRIRIWPAPGTNMATAQVEVATRPETLSVYARANVTVRGLIFEHANSCIGANGANVSSSSNVLLDGIQSDWNNWGGLGISSSRYLTVENSTASYNGGVGFVASRTSDVLFQTNESDDNNWRGAMGAFYSWAMGGMKLMEIHRAQVNAQSSYSNQAEGLWLDTDNSGIAINGAVLSGNLMANLMLEANEGPISVANSHVSSGSPGLGLNNSENVTVTGSSLIGNGTTGVGHAQILIVGPSSGRSFTNWETGQTYHVYTSNLVLQNNSIEDTNAAQFLFNTFITGTAWSAFLDSFHSSGNDWYDTAKTSAFLLPDGHHETLSGWQNVTGQDLSSRWAAATSDLASHPAPQPSYRDFQIAADNRTYAMSHGTVAIHLQLASFGAGPVALSAQGLPTGVRSAFSISTLTVGSSVLTLTASSTTPVETVPVTITAIGGSRVHTVTVNVSIAP